MIRRFIGILFFFLLFNSSYCQMLRMDRYDSLEVSSFRVVFKDTDVFLVYNRLRRFKVTIKDLGDTNDYRMRYKIRNRFRMVFDFVYGDLNPDNFFYSGGIVIRF